MSNYIQFVMHTLHLDSEIGFRLICWQCYACTEHRRSTQVSSSEPEAVNHRNTESSLLLRRDNLAKLWWFCSPYLMPFSVWDFIYKIRNCYWEKQKARLLRGEEKKRLYLPLVLQFHFAEYSLFGPYAFSVNLTLTPSHVLPPPLCRSFLT